MDEVKTSSVVKPAKLTQSAKVWEEIKKLEVDLFSLPHQTVEKHLQPVFAVSDNELYLNYKFSAVIPALEEVVKPKYGVEVRGKYLVVVPGVVDVDG
jgi:hypothetical protein